MKTKFAKEKSEYAYYLAKCIDNSLTDEEHRFNIQKLRLIEEQIKQENDEIIFIVTTKKTNPILIKTAPPMSMENIKNG